MANIVTSAEVYELAGISVDHELVAKAQLVVSTVSGFDLSDAAAYELLTIADRQHLVRAVVWEVVYLDRHPEALSGGDQAGNVASASANGASITFRDGDDGTLAPLAARELEALSWRRQSVTVRTLRPYSRATLRGPQPDPWHTL